MLFTSCEKNENDKPDSGAVKDIDGNEYKTVKIGNQVWFAENLKTTKYNNGTPIPNITDNTEWAELSTGAYAWYNNDEATYKNAYGALYNWFAVETGNLCPTGWRVPTDAEWSTLINYIDPNADGGNNWPNTAGGKMKSTRTTPDAHPRWESPNTGATDEYGFSALPGGFRYYYDGTFDNVGYNGYWWSSTEYHATHAWYRDVNYDDGNVGRDNDDKRNGISVRCLRDN